MVMGTTSTRNSTLSGGIDLLQYNNIEGSATVTDVAATSEATLHTYTGAGIFGGFLYINETTNTGGNTELRVYIDGTLTVTETVSSGSFGSDTNTTILEFKQSISFRLYNDDDDAKSYRYAYGYMKKL